MPLNYGSISEWHMLTPLHLDLAMSSPDHIFVTADYGFKSVDNLAQIEFLPAK